LGLNEDSEKDKGICKMGKIYKVGENGALVEQFKDIILTWKEDGSETLYKKLFHAFIGKFDICPIIFTNFQENTWTYQMSGGSLTKTFVLEDITKGIQASKQ
jgi:hypothetical protein